MGIIEIKKLELRFDKIIQLIKDKKKLKRFTKDDVIYIKSEIKDHYKAFKIIKKAIEDLGEDLPNGAFDDHFNHLESFTIRTKDLLENKK